MSFYSVDVDTLLANSRDAMQSNQYPEVDMICKELYEHNYVFLTGAGGCGKSTYTKEVIKRFNNPLVCASTGAAALILRGDTVHRVFKLGLNENITKLHLYDQMRIKAICESKQVDKMEAERIYFYYTRKILQDADLLVIDEVSMLSSNIIDMIFSRLKQFGITGLKILLVGDFLQLPPVAKNQKRTYAFDSEHWSLFKTVELTEVKRTDNPEFIYVLSQLRKGKYTQRVKDFIDAHSVDKLPDNCNMLYSLKRKVEEVNKAKLDEIDAPLETIIGKVAYIEESQFKNKILDSFLKNLITPHELKIKVGCRVMFTANEFTGMYTNGELGTVKEIVDNGDSVVVVKDNGNEVVVTPFAFEQYKVTDRHGNLEMVLEVKYMQIPLVVAYATTIHKAQGATIDAVGIDCKGIFEDSQFYVAISRAKNPDKLYISNFSRRCVTVDERVKDFYAAL